MDQPRKYLHLKRGVAKRKVPQVVDQMKLVTPRGSAAEVGKALRDFIRLIDTQIIGISKNWSPMLKKYLVLAKFAIGKTPREEAEALHSLITATELHLMEPERWYLRLWSPKVVAEVQSTRLLLGLEENEALNEAMRCGI